MIVFGKRALTTVETGVEKKRKIDELSPANRAFLKFLTS